MKKLTFIFGLFSLVIVAFLFAVLVPSMIQVALLAIAFSVMIFGMLGWAFRQWTIPKTIQYNDKGMAPIIQTGFGPWARFHDLNMTGAVYKPGQEFSEFDKALALMHMMTRGGSQGGEAMSLLMNGFFSGGNPAIAGKVEGENVVEVANYRYLPDPQKSEVFMSLAMEDLSNDEARAH